jgi:CheY-like chemotaxis protein
VKWPLGAERELLEECSEFLASLRADIPNIRDQSADKDTFVRMQRCAHTVKGHVSFLRAPEMTLLASWLSETLRRLRDDEMELTKELVDEIAGHTGKLTDLLASFGSSAEQTEADPTSRLQASVLSQAVAEVLSGFAVGEVSCSEISTRQFAATTRDLTVVLDSHGGLTATFIFEFDSAVARGLASRITEAMAGEAADVSLREREVVTGALGEMANRVVASALAILGLEPEITAPRFVDETGVGLLPESVELRGFPVDTGFGRFDVGFVPGASLYGAADASRTPKETAAWKRRAVIADDSPVMRKSLERVLIDAGYEVVAHASDGRRAVEEFRRHRPDLVTLDLNMPVMGGLDALRLIRADDPSARVLICSAIAATGMIRRGIKAGALGYVTKPYDPAKLIESIEYLSRARKPPGVPSSKGGIAPLDVPALGTYRVEEPLGEGGMAAVYKGYDPGLRREVALKVIKDEISGDVDFAVRFLEEARSVAKVDHPNVVRVYFAGSDRGKHFFAMELLPGPDLERLVRSRGALSLEEALGYLQQAALGLAAASEQGLIHCDVKPSNLIFGSDGLVRVTDFGIARHIGAQSDSTDSQVEGTPWFMAPEQVLGRELDHRTDIYALGATLYFLLTGSEPYDGVDKIEVALRQVHDPVPTLPRAPRRLNRLLARMMAKDPGARHADHDEVLREIGRFL